MGSGVVKLIAVLVLLTFVGCASDAWKPQGDVPTPSFVALRIYKLSGAYRISADGMEEYVARYGTRGWLRALSDERPASAALEGESGQPPSALRVKDIFANHYWKVHNRDARYDWPKNSTPTQRDVVIARICSELQPVSGSRIALPRHGGVSISSD
jgi:hypothetical protein